MTEEERQMTTILAIGTPAPRVAGGGRYTTDISDSIINRARIFTLALLGNVDNVGAIPFEKLYTDVLGHSFRNFYLEEDFESHDKIIDDIRRALN